MMDTWMETEYDDYAETMEIRPRERCILYSSIGEWNVEIKKEQEGVPYLVGSFSFKKDAFVSSIHPSLECIYDHDTTTIVFKKK
jgi:hypothetical protein